MEMKSVINCLNIIDHALIENFGKYIGISNWGNFHKNFLEKRQSDFIEDRVVLSNVLSQINCIIENHYQFAEEDIKKEYRAWNWYLTINCYLIFELKRLLPDENRYMPPKYTTVWML